jgi:PAS domain S-box-containing protein
VLPTEGLIVDADWPMANGMEQAQRRRSAATSVAAPAANAEMRLLRLALRVARAANGADALLDAGRSALVGICEATGWPIGRLYLPSAQDPARMAPSAVCHVEPGSRDASGAAALYEVTAELITAPATGGVARAAAAGTPVLADLQWGDRGDAAGRAGLRSAFALPVMSSSGVAAVLEFLLAEGAAPEPTLLDVLVDIGFQLGRVADRAYAQRGLTAGAERLERVLETSLEAFVAMSGEGIITRWNAAAERIFGLTREQATGRRLGDTIVPPRLRNPDQNGMLGFLATGDGRVLDRRVEITVWHTDGHEFPVELAMWAVPDGDEPGGWAFNAFIHDISERRRGEEAMRAAYDQKRRSVAHLTELDEVKRDFVTSVSHELRTPLTNVIGHLELLTSGDLGALTAVQSRALDVIGRNSARLRALIEDLLTVSRVEAGSFHLAFAPVDLPLLLQACRQAVQVRASYKDQQLTVDIDPALPVVVADPAQLQRAIVNLLLNAINFTPRGGQISLGASAAPGQIEITVTDSGVGIDAIELSRLFTRFYRGAFAVKESVQGAGLGLTITKTIVEGHGGTIAVTSAPGEGSAFTVRLPR